MLESNIEILELNCLLEEKLKDRKIFLIKDLWILKRKELKKLGFNDHEIIIKLELIGLDLNKKIY
ncbi:MAG: hypothetical protein IJB71_01495 [Bacilli bacterium]|nr:hypothetical protein [Bacilli bacterium]